MPQSARLWRHVIINTRSTRLHGDPRGFRTRKHRIDSSGDYRHPPPAGERGQLHEYHKDCSRPEAHIGRNERAIIGREIVRHLQTHGFSHARDRCHEGSCSFARGTPRALDEVKVIIGSAKRQSSCAVEQSMPGSIWAAGGLYKRVVDTSHRQNVFAYILYGQGGEAWTWSFRDGTLEGRFGRCRADV